ncbi:ATP-binding protein [Candidatus Daviesbacteria bacterium]|nr:ATP-binding protein [Candidatus Daviesbacteria bacterium]
MGKKKINKYQISIKPNQEERIEENFRLLKLDGMLASYKRLAKDFFKENLTPSDLIEKLQQAEASWDEGNRVDRWMRNAKFEINKTLQDFDFSYPTKINKTLVFELASCRYLENATNVAFLGPTGVGKTHLASALGREAIYAGLDVRFLSLRSLNEMIDKISDNPLQLRHLMNTLIRPKVLILDEIALFEPNNTLAKFLVELLLNRHLKSSTIFTSNKTFKAWVNAFGDTHTSAMVLDRITQKMEVVDIEGPSYRLKDRIEKPSEELYGNL